MFDDHTTLDVLKINFALFILFQGILHVIIKKMKYDESYNFEHEVYLRHLAGGRLWPCLFIAHKFFLLTGESDQCN